MAGVTGNSVKMDHFGMPQDTTRMREGRADLFVSGRLTGHPQCIAASDLFRGKLCEELGRRPSRRVKSGEFLYHMGDAARSVYLVRSGLVKTSLVSPGGHQLTLQIHKIGDILGELCLCIGERREQAMALERVMWSRSHSTC